MFSAFRISTSSADTATTPSTTNPASVSSSVTSGPLWSSSPCAVRSSTTTTSARPTTNSARCSMGATVYPSFEHCAATFITAPPCRG
ncbi:Uncharacterised protein [Mycobacterium tuberculosis]|nr:Uncharacterised protein [Mycobacterium tuberculosis]CPA64273.1 Uncharacterised protein [Mycobacterium tuberculosis]